jgi:nitroimidazol reductase NimA-like FMN-containing flavoprotein (pyridoxamine 5'-phosphate oxidase superfamily)
MSDGVIELDYEECLDLLRNERVGRIAVMAAHHPLIFPVNYRVVEDVDGGSIRRLVWIALRTRAGNVIDSAPMFVSFEIDHFDHGHRLGWSVLVSGTLQPVDVAAAEFSGRFDPEPWLRERDRWLVIEPTQITGRRLVDEDAEWAFSTAAYL